MVDQLFEMIRNSASLPLTPYRLVRGKEFEQMLERLRINVPSSIRESDRLLNERDRIIADAQVEAQRIIKEARQRALQLVGERAIVAQAQATADRIVREGRVSAQRRAEEADHYAVQVLEALAEHLRGTLIRVENGIEVMQVGDVDESAASPPSVKLPGEANGPKIADTAPDESNQVKASN